MREICSSCPHKFGEMNKDRTAWKTIWHGNAARRAARKYGVKATIHPVHGEPRYKMPADAEDSEYYQWVPRPLCICREDYPEMQICKECVHHAVAEGWLLRSTCFASRDDLGFDGVSQEHYPFCDNINTEGECAEFLEKLAKEGS